MQITRATAQELRHPELNVAERKKGHLLMLRDQRASDEPTARDLIARAYEDAIFVEAMPSELRGLASVFVLWVLAIAGWMLYRYVHYEQWKEWAMYFQSDFGWKSSGESAFNWLLGLATKIGISIFIPVALLASFVGLRIDLFAPKMNPIVFNRRTRKVYRYVPRLFSGNMILVEYDWDCIDAEYYSRTGPSGNVIRTQDTLDLFVRDRPGSDEVIDCFPLVASMMVGGERNARRLWEHIRRFMEERGPHLSPGDQPAPGAPRTAWQAVNSGPWKRKWIWFFIGAVWTLPELFYLVISLADKNFVSYELWSAANNFPRHTPELIHWWMLYPTWNKDLASLVWLGKLFLILPCYLFTLQGFFAVLASKLSPEATLPEDLSAQAGAPIDLRALAAGMSRCAQDQRTA